MSSSLRARLTLESLHFAKTTLEVSFSENVDIVIGLVLASHHFVKSTLVVGKFLHDSFLAG